MFLLGDKRHGLTVGLTREDQEMLISVAQTSLQEITRQH